MVSHIIQHICHLHIVDDIRVIAIQVPVHGWYITELFAEVVGVKGDTILRKMHLSRYTSVVLPEDEGPERPMNLMSFAAGLDGMALG
jgi:hypothetical protein